MKTLVLALMAAGALASAALEEPERISQSGNDPGVLVYPTLPGLMTAQGYSGGVLGSGYDPLLGEVRQAIIPPSYTHYGGSTNVFMDPITEQFFKYPDSIIVAADSETSSVTVSRWVLRAACQCSRKPARWELLQPAPVLT